MASRSEFLRRLPPAVRRTATVPPIAYRDNTGAPMTGDDRVSLFQARWQALGGHVHLAPEGGVAEAVADIAAGRTRILVADHELLAAVPDAVSAASSPPPVVLRWPGCGVAQACTAEMAVVVGIAALAATGSVVLDSRVAHGRSPALLPPEVVFVLHASTVLNQLGELLRRTGEVFPAGLPSQLVVVSGPSRSADIEHTLTRGVHGPGEVHAVIVGA